MHYLTAVRFEKAMTSGRTRPLVLGCEEGDEDGGGAAEYVVKLRGSNYTGGVRLAWELVASGLPRPSTSWCRSLPLSGYDYVQDLLPAWATDRLPPAEPEG